MKAKFISICIATCLLSSTLFAPNVINKCIRFEEAPGEHTTQMAFEFVNPFYYEKKEVVAGERLKLFFPGMRLAEFKRLKVVNKIKVLPMVVDVALWFEKRPVPRVVLSLQFEKQSVILRITKMDEPNLLLLDIFKRDTLETLRKKVTTTLHVCNEVHGGAVLCLNALKKKRKLSPHKAHIVIDAGHGGKDMGAGANGLREKEITLDIARRVYASLKREGYRVFLTRNTDSYLSVVDRAQLAKQLRADLFVSVHANAAPGLQGVSGIETHTLCSAPFFGKHRNSQLLFISDPRGKRLARVADVLLHKKIAMSRVLANSIQNSVLGYLKQKNISVVNRGVKKTGFRTLLRSEVPASIVEVGFLTNKLESSRLKKPLYRHFLARGICNGIKAFFVGDLL